MYHVGTEAVSLSVLVACISFTVSRAQIFNWLRVGLTRVWAPLGQGVGCFYCLSLWVAALAALFCASLSWPVAWLTIAWLAIVQQAIVAVLLRGIGGNK